jgi:chromosomal replication initiation ATPase DnaA
VSDPIQLTLTFEHRTSLSGEDFLIAPCNREAVQWLDRWQSWPSPVLVLYGPAGCGKTHLTHVFLAATGGRDITDEFSHDDDPSAYLSQSGAFVVEGIEALLADGSDEKLFHLYNVARELDAKILFTAESPPSRWETKLPDLASRFKAATAIGIGPPEDELIGALLVKHFSDRQLKVDEDVIPYVLARMERSFEAARDVVSKADALALSKHRNITIPLMRQVFKT